MMRGTAALVFVTAGTLRAVAALISFNSEKYIPYNIHFLRINHKSDPIDLNSG